MWILWTVTWAIQSSRRLVKAADCWWTPQVTRVFMWMAIGVPVCLGVTQLLGFDLHAVGGHRLVTDLTELTLDRRFSYCEPAGCSAYFRASEWAKMCRSGGACRICVSPASCLGRDRGASNSLALAALFNWSILCRRCNCYGHWRDT